mmetsp:Transcript_45016/g.144240  ORF Transcript_45016/g.144240 Transcript_45016/m.144240 type:complete len:458 (+) Transcript_45016:75-1448(+)
MRRSSRLLQVPLCLVGVHFLLHLAHSLHGCVSVAFARLPRATPLPPQIVSDVPGTWAYDTMSRRVREEIVEKVVIGDNAGAAPFEAVKVEINALRDELSNAGSTALTHVPEAGGGPDLAAWRAIMEPHVTKGDTWLSAPWCVTEFYLYRRIAGILRYWSSGFDPFAKAKGAGLRSAVGSLDALAPRVLPVMASGDASGLFLSIALWGNRMDLSLWPAGANVASVAGAFQAVLDAAQEQLLADDTAAVEARLQALRARGGGIVDLIVDNAGFELCTDMLLADHLVASGAAKQVRFRVKHHPTFVSDALEVDVRSHIDELVAGGGDSARLARRWRQHLESGAWTLHADHFWAMPPAMWEMPEPLYQELASSSALAVVKGDANYRRVLGDRPWPLDTPFADVASYWPCPVLCLRTLKAELGCGMAKPLTDRAAAADPNWLVNGRWGVVQHFGPDEPAATR